MAVTDAGLLIYLIDETQEYIINSDGERVEFVQERIKGLIDLLSKRKEKLVIPAPVLAEVLVKVAPESVDEVLAVLHGQKVFKVADFDSRAAVECALMTSQAEAAGDKKSGSDDTWQRVKIDRQLAAIAKTNNESVVYTGDTRLRNFLSAHGISVVPMDELPIPDDARQKNLEFGASPKEQPKGKPE